METPNYSLNTLGLYKAQSWSKLTAQEIKQANDDLESIKKNPAFVDFKQDASVFRYLRQDQFPTL
jgi:hypothetical protein